MGVWSFTLKMRPSALLCTSLVLLVFLFPETSLAGKKGIAPVKHLFGIGIGYQKVVHYKPVLVFSKSRRLKKPRRPAGWGWSGDGGGGVGGTSQKYSPVVVKQNIHKHGKSGYPPPPPQRHRRKRKRPHHHHHQHPPQQSHSSGWGGWRQGWRRPHRSHRKGHGGGSRYHNLDQHHEHHYPSNHGGDLGGDSSYEHSPPSYHYHHHPEISDYPSSEHHDDYRSGGGGGIWGGSAVGGGGAVVYPPSHSSTYYGSPYSSIEDIEDDVGGYESEIREEWKKDVPPNPSSTLSPSTTILPTPSEYPFTDNPQNSDGSVTNIQKDFLKNHMKNFHQFQEYQQATTSDPRKDSEENHFAPHRLRPPGPYFSTMDPQSSEGGGEQRGNVNYDVEYSDDDNRSGGGGADNYYDDYNGSNNNELHKKMMTAQSTQMTQVIQTTAQPNLNNQVTNLISNGMQQQSANNNFQRVITALPKSDTQFKPSPRVEEMGGGNSFNKPGFFPTFQQFQQIKMS